MSMMKFGVLLNKLRYSLYSPIYDVVVSALQNARRKSVERLNIPDNARILIVGAGTGKDLPFLPPEADITATDITPAMLTYLDKEANRLGLDVDIIVMDASELLFEDESFDIVLLHLILAVVPDPEGCIREAARVTKPDGVISIMDKFVPEGQKSSLLRQMVNLITRVLFSDITRQAEPYLELADLEKTDDCPVFMGGQFRHIQARKRVSVEQKRFA
ncbi:class I SAM-dependent methyltransferase [Oceanospirillum sediminis]|uniref:Class I SAM-dependent methyltransferase n=1 Tax=Oceanospirillum sediminis TaxID=2760088 RepID=A0A839IUQ6_9GAMM|nr:class I SAM-dependent methyltransferase [Oceanospirillum sediminis]MBB1488157.1 class I SAM-dependent methyltransferase [Oceanospirillum sediminis]